MDLSRGRLELVGRTYPITDGWITTAYPDRRKLEELANASLHSLERRRDRDARLASRPRGAWVVIGHFILRGAYNIEELTQFVYNPFLVVRGLNIEIIQVKPEYAESRNRKFIFAASSVQRWNFVGLTNPNADQLGLLPRHQRLFETRAGGGQSDDVGVWRDFRHANHQGGTPLPKNSVPPRTPTPRLSAPWRSRAELPTALTEIEIVQYLSGLLLEDNANVPFNDETLLS